MGQQTFIQQLLELRRILLKVLVVILVIFGGLLFFANSLYTLVSDPLKSLLPANAHMIATEVASPFLAPFKLTFIISIALSLPYIFYKLWQFIAPGLYKNERRLVFPLIFSSMILFVLGVIFAYFVVLPLMFNFFYKECTCKRSSYDRYKSLS